MAKDWLREMREAQLSLAERISAQVVDELPQSFFEEMLNAGKETISSFEEDRDTMPAEVLDRLDDLANASDEEMLNIIKNGLIEETAYSLQSIVEDFSWFVAEQVFFIDDWKERDAILCDSFLSGGACGNAAPTLSFDGEVLARQLLETSVHEFFVDGERELPNVGKFARRNQKTYLFLDKEGLERIEKLFETEAEMEREYEECKDNPPAPRMTQLGDINYDDEE
ncbi:hypothetical protein KJ885_04045 [Patescibacteria group bacterium]|nr:hypothetical protein [Patescibacteria group bacterium]